MHKNSNDEFPHQMKLFINELNELIEHIHIIIIITVIASYQLLLFISLLFFEF